jgi:hypothetical protein
MWAAADYVYRGPVGYGAVKMVEYVVLRELARRSAADAVQIFREGLRDPDPQVVGYCIVGLELLGVPMDQAAIAGRNEQIRWRLASFEGTSTLAEFAELAEP